MADQYFVGDVGTEILVDCGEDISLGTNLELKVKKPSGTEVTWSGTLSGTNFIKYIIQAGDFDEAGTYFVNASLTLGAWAGHGETATIPVYALGEIVE